MFGIIIGVISTIAKALAVASLAIEGLKKIGQALVSIGQRLGLIPQQAELEDMGEKGLQMDENGCGYDPEKESYKEYMERLNEFEIDPEKKHDERKVLEKGVVIASGAIIDEFPDCSDLIETVILRGEELDIPDNELEKYIQSDKSKDIASYLSGNEKNIDIRESAIDTIADIQKQLNPQMSDNEAYRKAFSMEK